MRSRCPDVLVERRYFVLIGQPRPSVFREALAVMARRPSRRRAVRGEALQRAHGLCWVWIGGVSSTGHGSFRAASLSGPTRRGTVPAHLFAYQLAHGVIPRLGWSGAEDAVICHQCDFAGATRDVARTYPVSEWNPAAPASRTRWRTRREGRRSARCCVRPTVGRSR